MYPDPSKLKLTTSISYSYPLLLSQPLKSLSSSDTLQLAKFSPSSPMAHSYKSEYPTGIQVDEGIKQFFEEFYKISDAAPASPDAHEKYADAFTKDATLIVASKKGVGRDGEIY
jgi:hypothetical protein